MQNDIAVKVMNVSLSFNLHLHKENSKMGRLLAVAKKLQGGVNKKMSSSNHSKFMALKDISLDIKKGELLGIVGRNGAGKTVLTRVMAGIYTPTTGQVLVDGKVDALFSLSGGFQQNMELSGRENLYNYCIFTGRKKSEIKGLVDKMAEFSELGEFMDAPVKTYSSGMKGRLIFSAAVFMEPDIIILDEVLVAGDPAFSKKASNVLEIFKKRGATIIFVSHSIAMVRSKSTRVVWLNEGKVAMEGLPDEVLDEYEKFINNVSGVVREVDVFKRSYLEKKLKDNV